MLYDQMMKTYGPVVEGLPGGNPQWFIQEHIPTLAPSIGIVRENPSREECFTGDFFQGPSGLLFQTALEFAGLKREQLYVIDVFPFSKPKKHQWKVSEVDHVADFIQLRMEQFPIVVVIGKSAMRVYSAENENIQDISGKVIPFQRTPQSPMQHLIPSVGPNYVVKAYTDPTGSGDVGVFWYMVLALKNAKRLAEGKELFGLTKAYRPSLATDVSQLEQYLANVPAGARLVVDFEATHTNPYLSSVPTCVGLSFGGVEAMVAAFNPWYPQSTISSYQFYELLAKYDHFEYVIHNLLYDLSLMTRFGYKGRPPVLDTMFMAHLCFEFMPKSLKFLAPFFCDVEPYDFKFKYIKSFLQGTSTYEESEYWLVKMLHYAGMDAVATHAVMEVLPQITGTEWGRCEHLYKDYIHPCLIALHNIQKNGLILNQDKLAIVREEMKKTLVSAEKNFKSLVNGVENIRSNPQLGAAFKPIIQQVAPELLKETKTGISLTADVLKALAERGVQAAQYLLDYRKVSKQLTTYIDSYPQYLDSEGKIHTQFGFTKTFRLKSGNPALQVLPRKSIILSLFTSGYGLPPYDYIWIKADYSAAEMRLLAFFCGIAKLLDPTIDVHILSATMFFGVPMEEVTKEMRQNTKALGFGTIYGASAMRIALALWGDASEENQYKAQQLLDKFLIETFPEIKKFMENREADVNTLGYVEMPKGLRRHFPVESCALNATTRNPIYSFDHGAHRFSRMIFRKGVREAYNMFPQSGVAYLTNKALSNLDRIYKELDNWNHGNPTLNLQIHDALITRVHKKDFVRALRTMKEVMMYPYMGPDIPLEFEVGWEFQNLVHVIEPKECLGEIDWNKIYERTAAAEEKDPKSFAGMSQFLVEAFDAWNNNKIEDDIKSMINP